jgi:RecA/RadA recombinase
MSLIDRLIKNSTIDETATLEDSKIYGKSDMIPTPVPMINVALSGSIDGGLTPGLTILAGPSKHFKTGFSLLIASSFLKKYPEGVILFYDSEFGTPQSYFDTFGIPLDRVVHTTITDVEQLKHDVMKQLDSLERTDKVCIVIDSVGNLASKKEVDDALEGKSVADMSRAKALKSLFRMVTPHLTLKDLPMIVVNHTYKEMALYPRDIVSGGTGIYYSANTIWILGRQQEKDSDGITGYHFVINVEKSRFVREKSKIPITVSFTGGIKKWSGLLDLALEAKVMAKPKNGWYQLVDPETGELIGNNMRLAEVEDNKELWMALLKQGKLTEFIKNKYSLTSETPILEEANEDD